MIPVALACRLLIWLAWAVADVSHINNEGETTLATRKKKVTINADAVREVIMLEGVLKLDLCARCGARPGPEHRPTHDRWLAETRALDAAWTLPAKEGR